MKLTRYREQPSGSCQSSESMMIGGTHALSRTAIRLMSVNRKADHRRNSQSIENSHPAHVSQQKARSSEKLTRYRAHVSQQKSRPPEKLTVYREQPSGSCQSTESMIIGETHRLSRTAIGLMSVHRKHDHRRNSQPIENSHRAHVNQRKARSSGKLTCYREQPAIGLMSINRKQDHRRNSRAIENSQPSSSCQSTESKIIRETYSDRKSVV